jgi:hypothetical protein
MKAPRRPAVGEQRTTGEVRPVTNRTLIGISVGVVAVVVIAITVLIAASGTPKTNTDSTNVPQALPSGSGAAASSSATYRESIQLPSGSNREQVVPAVLSLRCSGLCSSGTLDGYLGTFTLTAEVGATTRLTGTLQGSCETITLTPQGELSSAPQILTGTITRPDTCTQTTTTVPTPIEVRLDRT